MLQRELYDVQWVHDGNRSIVTFHLHPPQQSRYGAMIGRWYRVARAIGENDLEWDEVTLTEPGKQLGNHEGGGIRVRHDVNTAQDTYKAQGRCSQPTSSLVNLQPSHFWDAEIPALAGTGSVNEPRKIFSSYLPVT